MNFFKEIINLANDNSGFINLVEFIFIVLTTFGVLNYLRPKPVLFAAAVTGAKFPREITLTVNNLSSKEMIIHDMTAVLAKNIHYNIEMPLPGFLKIGENTVIFKKDLNGWSRGATHIEIIIKYGFPNSLRPKCGTINIDIDNQGRINVKKGFLLK